MRGSVRFEPVRYGLELGGMFTVMMPGDDIARQLISDRSQAGSSEVLAMCGMRDFRSTSHAKLLVILCRQLIHAVRFELKIPTLLSAI